MEKSNVIMLDGFTVREYPDWEKVGYVKFDVGFFNRGKLDGYGKRYILEAVYQNNKKVSGYERITIGYFKDDKLNGIGIKIEDNEILEYGFYKDDRLIDTDLLMHDLPKTMIDSFYFNGAYQGEAVYYGERVNDRKATGQGVVIDRKDRLIFANYIDGFVVPGLYIIKNKDKVTYDFLTFDETSTSIAGILLNNTYRPRKDEDVLPRGTFACYKSGDQYSEGYFDENGQMQGLGFKDDGRQSGIYVDDKLVFGSYDYDANSAKSEEYIENKHMVLPNDFKGKKIKYKNGIYIGELDDKTPNGFGQYFEKSAEYDDLMNIYKKREIDGLFIGNVKSIPEQIKNGDICYIATFKKGKFEGYCTRWKFRSSESKMYFYWEYDQGIIAYKDRFKPDMSLYEYYELTNPKQIVKKKTIKNIFDTSNKSYVNAFLKQRLFVDTSETVVLDIENAKYFINENNPDSYEMWIYLTPEQNEKYLMYHEQYIENLKKHDFKKTGEKSFLQKDGLFELVVIDEGKNIRISIKKNFRSK